MNKNPLLSIVIPVYGTEAFIEKCLNSICKSSYKNLEIICVNDATKDNSMEIVAEIAKKDARIKTVTNEKNLGLFRARVEGMKVAAGEYIAFVDSDDYVSCDWFRQLIERSLETDADMVIGNTLSVDEKGRIYYFNNYHSFTQSYDTIEHDDLLPLFYEQEGACFAWHTVWNKVYSARLIRKCFPYFEKIDSHLIMGEDIAYSSVLYTHANRLAFANADCYFYYRHSQASTSTSLPKASVLRNINHLSTVFKFVECCLSEYSKELYDKYSPAIARFKARYQRIWRGNIHVANLNEDEDALQAMRETFGDASQEYPRPNEFYFYELTGDWDGRFENLKKSVLDDQYEVISFDMFDTLVTRPFYDPLDLFRLIGRQVNKTHPHITEDLFYKLRILADEEARKTSKNEGSESEDVTLTQIYKSFAILANISEAAASAIQKLEEDSEIYYCTLRKSMKSVFDLAIFAGKRVVITSDMYLERSTIEAILEKNGFTGYENLFLSSEVGKLKKTGKLFEHMANACGCDKKAILHIGDNWNIDYVAARDCDIQSAFFPKAIETAYNGISDIYAGALLTPFTNKFKTDNDTTVALNQLPIRCALGLIANKLYDNPYRGMQRASNYNGDSYYMGYAALGLEVLGIANWIYNEALKNGYSKIVFLARDGKMVKKAFDMICQAKGNIISSDYFYATRKSLMPYSIKCAEDFYNLYAFIDVKKHTPLNILNMFADILIPLDDDIIAKYSEKEIKLEEYFADDKSYFEFISALIDISYNEDLRQKSWEKASSAFSSFFGKNAATFDLGYSGRLQSIICDLVGSSVDTFFLHDNGYSTTSICKENFKIHTYFDHTPTITGIIREYFMSDPVPSCIGYEFNGLKIIPIMEENTDRFTFDCLYAIRELQKGALHFVKDYLGFFGNLDNLFTARKSDYSIAFEHFLLNSTEFDRYTFSNSIIEDEVYSGYSKESLFATWSWHLSTMQGIVSAENTQSVCQYDLGKGKLKKFIFYMMYDRRTLKDKVKEKLKKHKILLGILRFFYKVCRKIYRLFKRKPKKQ